MTESQVTYDNQNNHSVKIRSAIDMLLSSDAVIVSEPSVKLTECSPDIDVVMNGQGGICTNCNVMFLSGTSLKNHLKECNPRSEINKVKINYPNAFIRESPISKKPRLRLVVVSDN